MSEGSHYSERSTRAARVLAAVRAGNTAAALPMSSVSATTASTAAAGTTTQATTPMLSAKLDHVHRPITIPSGIAITSATTTSVVACAATVVAS